MPAVTIGNAAERRTLAEAVRAAILTVHAAAGLASGADPQTQRLLRASEGLSRSALAVLLASPPGASPQQPRAPRPVDAPRRRRRPRGKRSRGPKDTAMEEDGTEKPEPSGDAPAVNRDAAATVSGPTAVELPSGCPASCNASVRAPARAPLPLLQVVGRAGASEELDDRWADDMPELRRDQPLDAKRFKPGKTSEGGAVVSLTSCPPSSPLATSAVQPPGLVELRQKGETELYDTLIFQQLYPDGLSRWKSTWDPMSMWIFDPTVGGWEFVQLGEDGKCKNVVKRREDLVMSPPFSSW